MGKITFTQKRIFDGTSSSGTAIIKYKALIYIGRINGEVWTYNPMSGRLKKITVLIDGASDSVRDFTVGTDGILYAVTGGTDGKLFSYDNDSTWTELADTSQTVAYRVLEYNGNFYIGDNFGQVHVWDGTTLSISLTAGASGETNMQAIGVFEGHLFVGGDSATAKIFEFDGSTWTTDHTLAGTNPEIIDFAEYKGEFYAAAAHDSIGTILRKNSVSSPQDWDEIHAAPDSIDYKAIEVFSGNLYAAGGAGAGDRGHIERYDGNQWVTINTDTTLKSWDELFADSDVIYALDRTVGASNNDTAMWALSPVCDDELFISEAMPFSFNLGTCDPTPDLCDVEDGCFCQIADQNDQVTLQIEYSGPGTPIVQIREIISKNAFIRREMINTSGNFWEFSYNLGAFPPDTYEIVVYQGNAWVEVDNLPLGITNGGAIVNGETTDFYMDIFFISKNIGWMIATQFSGGALMLKTTNGGANWSQTVVTDFEESTAASMSFANNLVGWLVGQSDITDIFFTDDGGATWSKQSPPVADNQYWGVVAPSTIVAIAVGVDSGTDGVIIFSADGLTWATATLNVAATGNSFLGVDMFDDTTGWAVGEGGDVYKTTDGGANWTEQVSGVATDLHAVHAISASIAIAAGASSVIRRTTDGGTNWGAITSPSAGTWKDIDFSGATGYMVGLGGIFGRSVDSGATWVADTEEDVITGDVWNVSAIDANNAWAAGLNAINIGLFNRLGLLAGTEKATSECIKVLANHDCDVLIKYTNDTDFAGIDYDGGFLNQIRIKAHFWRIQTPQTKTIHELSNEEIILTRQTVKKQVILETDIMPEYMHEKLSLIFSHGAVQIDDKEYVAEENYEYELGTKFRQVKGTVRLTERTYTKENIY